MEEPHMGSNRHKKVMGYHQWGIIIIQEHAKIM